MKFEETWKILLAFSTEFKDGAIRKESTYMKRQNPRYPEVVVNVSEQGGNAFGIMKWVATV